MRKVFGTSSSPATRIASLARRQDCLRIADRRRDSGRVQGDAASQNAGTMIAGRKVAVVLPACNAARTRRRDSGDASPRSPVFAAVGDGDGGHDRVGPLRRGAGAAHSGGRRADRRNAPLQIRVQPRADSGPETVDAPKAVGISYRLSCVVREVLERRPPETCSDDFVFDNQMLAQVAWFGMHIGEISCPTPCFAEASGIYFKRSVTYGLE